MNNNIIEIEGNPDLTNATLYGYYDTPTTHSGNTLNIHTTGLTAKNIYNFENINFYLPSNVDTTTPVLTLTDSSTDISGAQVLAGVEGNANLNVGDTVTLLTNAGTITDTNTTYGKLTEGVSLAYDLTVSKSGDNKIIATVGSVTKDIPEIIPIPHIPLVNPPELSNEDFDFEQDGLDSFFDNEQKGWEIFTNYGGGPMRYKLNNGHIDTTNQNANMGFARSVGNIAGKMTIAPVIDYQNTNGDTYLNDGTHSRTNSKYTGGGFVLRNLYRSGFYYETSFRAGRVKNNFASDDLKTAAYNNTVTYNTSAPVYNGHLKLGKYLRLDKNNLLDIYGFYYHTHQGGSNADLSSGEHYNFSSANAGRARIGYRLTTRTSKISQVYTGLAYQYEHNGGVTANYKEYSTLGESHNGSSGMLEIGWLVKPFKNNLWGVHLNTTGWIGNQRGVKAFAKIQKNF